MPPLRPTVAPPGALRAHLLRGVLGFGCLAAALVLAVAAGPVALLLLVPAALALRGCPTCWLVGLVAVLTARRRARPCSGAACAERRAPVGTAAATP